MAYSNNAADITNSVFAGSEAALRAAQQNAQIKNQADIAALQGLQNTGVGHINTSYDQLLADLSRNRGGAMTNINNAAQAMGAANNQGFQTAALAQQESRNYLEQLASRLGGTSFGDRIPLAQGAQEATFNRIGEINRNRAQELLNAFSVWGQQQDVSYGRTEENMRGRQAADVGGFQSQIGNQMAQAQMAGREQEMEALQALMELGSRKGQFGTDLAQQLANMEMQAQEANARFAAQADEMNFRREQAAIENSMKERQFAAQGNDQGWEREKFYAALGLDRDKLNSANDQWMMEWANQPQEPNTYTGRQGMEAFLEERGRNPILADYVDRAFAMVATDPQYANQDPYAVVANNSGQLLNRLVKGGQPMPQIDNSLWRQLAGIRQGGY